MEKTTKEEYFRTLKFLIDNITDPEDRIKIVCKLLVVLSQEIDKEITIDIHIGDTLISVNVKKEPERKDEKPDSD